MKDTMKISTFHLMLLICTFLAISSQLSLPSALSDIVKQDAWLSYFFPIIYGIGVGMFFYQLVLHYPGKNVYEITNFLYGKVVGGVLNALLIIFITIDLCAQTRLFTEFFSSAILIRTPPELIILLLMLLIIYYSTGTVVNLVSTNIFLFIVFSVVLILQPVQLINEMDMNKLEPIMGDGFLPPLKSNILAAVSYGDIIAIGALLNHVRKARDIYIAMKCGVIISSVMLTLWNFCLTSVLGPVFVARFIFAGWILVQQIHITDFLDRVDLIEFSVYFPLILIKYAVLFFSILSGLSSYTKERRFFGNLMVGLFISLLSIVAFEHTEDVVLFNNLAMVPISLLAQIIFFGSLIIASLVHKARGGLEVKVTSKMETGRYGKLVWVALIGCGASIVFGSAFGSMQGWYGLVGAGLYSGCLLLSVYFALRQYGEAISDNR